jgi:hypothetical protein
VRQLKAHVDRLRVSRDAMADSMFADFVFEFCFERVVSPKPAMPTSLKYEYLRDGIDDCTAPAAGKGAASDGDPVAGQILFGQTAYTLTPSAPLRTVNYSSFRANRLDPAL